MDGLFAELAQRFLGGAILGRHLDGEGDVAVADLQAADHAQADHVAALIGVVDGA
jgi:hypothetical protein